VDDEDKWYGFFQGYRPHGDGIEELFSVLPDVAEYAKRLRSVCRAAHHAAWAQDAYFVVRIPGPATDDELIAFGQELLSGLRLLAVLALLAGNRELHSYLTGVTRVGIVPLDALDRKHDDHLFVHNSVGDFLRGFYDYSHRIVQLREAYYSVACDYWLAWYLQWPYFRQWVPRDVFRPYFELWARGYSPAFQGDSLCLARDRPRD
jgi:hypothetical protein